MVASTDSGSYAPLVLRIAAYSVDIVLLFIGILATQALLKPVNPLLGRSAAASGFRHHLWVYATVSLPILIYFALCVSSNWRATIGMKLLGIHVSGLSGAQLSIVRGFLRSFVMLIPFELNHIVMFYPAPIWKDPKPGFRYGFIITGVLMMIYLGAVLISEHHQSIHDLVAKTVVVRNR